MLGHSSHPSGGAARCFDVEIQRGWIEAGDLRPALAALAPLLADAQAVRRFQGRLHLFVGGYDDDPRQLWDIVEVRRYLRALDQRFPTWLWFVDPADPALLLLVGCCCEGAEYGTRGNEVAVQIYPAQLAPFMLARVRNLHALVDEFGIAAEHVARIAVPPCKRMGVDAAMVAWALAASN